MEKFFKHPLVLIIIGISLLLATNAIGQDYGIAYCLFDRQASESGISIVNNDGSGYKQLHFLEGKAGSPSWSPNGRQIAFSANKIADGNSEIYIINADGTNLRNITNTPRIHEENPSWSPDGSKLVFGRYPFSETSQTYIMDIDSRECVRLFRESPIYNPKWSPDGSQIAFCQDGDVCIFDINTEKITNITKTIVSYEQDPGWSPDGKYIVYSMCRNFAERDYEIYQINIESRNIRQLTESPGVDMMPCFSPDGKQIAFVSDRDGRDENYDIFVMDALGDNVVKLTDTPLSEWYPAWSKVPLAVDGAGKMETNWGKVKFQNY